MALSNAERAARYRQKMKNGNRHYLSLWIDNELNTVIDNFLKTKEGLNKESVLHKVLLNALQAVTSNDKSVTSNDTSNETLLNKNKELTAQNELLQSRINELEIIATSNVTSSNKKVTSNEIDNKSSVTSNDNDITSNETRLEYNIDKSKAIAKELQSKGLSASAISKELAQMGYGGKKGIPFHRSTILKWKS